VPYGMNTWGDLFTLRQLATLNTLSDLARQASGLPDSTNRRPPPNTPEADNTSRHPAIAVYLSFAVSRMADRHSTLCRWDPNPSGYAPKIANTFGSQYTISTDPPYYDNIGYADLSDYFYVWLRRSLRSLTQTCSQRGSPEE
jgi:adenine-specific DNA methylase